MPTWGKALYTLVASMIMITVTAVVVTISHQLSSSVNIMGDC